MGLLSRLFSRKPRYHVSAYAPVYSAIVARLERQGVKVGGTAGYPRIEVHTITEGERLDKEGELRQLSLTVECVSDRSMAEAVALNEKNLELLTDAELNPGTGWSCIGIIPTQLQDLTETGNAQAIVYRLLQQFSIFIERVKEDDSAEAGTGSETAVQENQETQDNQSE